MNVNASKIRGRMREMGLSQEELADKISISRRTLNTILQTGKISKADTLSKIAHVLQLREDEFLIEEGPVVTTGNIRSFDTNVGEHIHALPLISIRGAASIVDKSMDGFQLKFIEETYPVYLPEGLGRQKFVVVEVDGDSMEPQIRDRSKVLTLPIPMEDIKYESGGVYAIFFANRFVVKRIKTNDINTTGFLTLHSDNEQYGAITIPADEIRAMLKVAHVVFSGVR
ncbi:XRE family transcriptional regulator [Tellurirhabdus bombi]|uniref:XRE family transcriptional regulator n=1 Tax=Tellurirhabdus bombi TaxID=2907205 RepID=UPI001F160328|nr:S24 family peptidase [Tellurirhabdus bombi]